MFFNNVHHHHHHHHKSWAQCPLTSDAGFTIFCQLLRSSAKWLSCCRFSPHHSTISSVHSLCGRHLLFLPSTFPKSSIFSFLSYRPSRSLCSANRNLLLIPPHTTNFSRRTFSFVAATVWNKLPTGIRECNTLHTFKHRLKTLFTSHPS